MKYIVSKTNFENLRVYQLSEYETQHWLRRAYKRDLLKEEEVNRIKPIVGELAPKLNAYLKSIGKMPGKTTDN